MDSSAEQEEKSCTPVNGTAITALTLSVLLVAVCVAVVVAWTRQAAEIEQWGSWIKTDGPLWVSAPASTGCKQIPKILHQIWFPFKKGGPEEPYPHLQKLTNQMRELHPHWEYKLWSEEEIVRLIQDKCPWFLQTFQSYDVPVKKHDSARVVILYYVGGVYFDHDTIVLRTLDPLLENNQLVLGIEPGVNCDRPVNAFMACVPGHPFMLNYLRALPAAAGEYVIQATGPGILSRVLKEDGYYYRKHAQHGIRVWHRDIVSGLLIGNYNPRASRSIEQLKQELPNTYALGLYEGSWKGACGV